MIISNRQPRREYIGDSLISLGWIRCHFSSREIMLGSAATPMARLILVCFCVYQNISQFCESLVMKSHPLMKTSPEVWLLRSIFAHFKICWSRSGKFKTIIRLVIFFSRACDTHQSLYGGLQKSVRFSDFSAKTEKIKK